VVPKGAEIAVRALGLVGCEGAADRGGAGVIRADVAVIAHEERSAHALARFALVCGGAGVAVVARGLVVHERAARFGNAGIIRAKIAVIAVENCAAGTHARLAAFADCAGILVVASQSFVGGNDTAFPSVRSAGGSVAERVQARWLGAGEGGTRLHNAFPGKRSGVAFQRAVAQVPVFEFLAVRVGLATAVQGISRALTLSALVVHRAGLAVVARKVVGLIDAPFFPRARIVCARVGIVADQGRTDTGPVLTVVSHSAGIPVHALGSGLGLVEAATLASTRIDRALVGGVTRLFVGFSVAIIV